MKSLTIHSFSSLSERKKRRSIINEAMSEKIDSGYDCHSCVGHCCTFEHNSMQVTPLQALDTYEYLKEKNLINKDLKQKLNDCIKHFRLDKEVISSLNKQFRRYYTCPFYSGDKLGCTIDRESKPYGCLAFNPSQMNVSQAGSCSSQTSILENQSVKFSVAEKQMNTEIKKELDLYWDKMNFPSALMYLIEKLPQKKE